MRERIVAVGIPGVCRGSERYDHIALRPDRFGVLFDYSRPGPASVRTLLFREGRPTRAVSGFNALGSLASGALLGSAVTSESDAALMPAVLLPDGRVELMPLGRIHSREGMLVDGVDARGDVYVGNLWSSGRCDASMACRWRRRSGGWGCHALPAPDDYPDRWAVGLSWSGLVFGNIAKRGVEKGTRPCVWDGQRCLLLDCPSGGETVLYATSHQGAAVGLVRTARRKVVALVHWQGCSLVDSIRLPRRGDWRVVCMRGSGATLLSCSFACRRRGRAVREYWLYSAGPLGMTRIDTDLAESLARYRAGWRLETIQSFDHVGATSSCLATISRQRWDGRPERELFAVFVEGDASMSA